MTRPVGKSAIVGSACLLLALSGGASASQQSCPALAIQQLRVFDADPMVSEDASEQRPNPCTGVTETVAVDYKPGIGFVQSFISGDVYAEVDPFVVLQCKDGRAMVRNAAEKKTICDTR